MKCLLKRRIIDRGRRGRIKSFVKLMFCLAVEIITVLMWISPSHFLSSDYKGYLMNYYSLAFVFVVFLNIVTAIINLVTKFNQLCLNISTSRGYEFFLHILTLFGAGPANILSVFFFCYKINDPIYQYYHILAACLHIVIAFTVYRVIIWLG